MKSFAVERNEIAKRRRAFVRTLAFGGAAVCLAPTVIFRAISAAEPSANGVGVDVERVAFSPETNAAIDAGLRALAARQNPDGSFGSESELFGRDPGVAALCGLAFLASGSAPGRGRFGVELDKIVDYLLSLSVDASSSASPNAATRRFLEENELTLADVDGLIVDFRERGRKPTYGHGYATFFLAEVLGATRRAEVRDRLRAAVALIVRTQNAEGGWRYEPKRVAVADISVTTCQLSALRAARDAGIFVPPETVARALAYVERCQNANGGFRYMTLDGPSGFARTAAAIQALQAGGADDSSAIEKAFRDLERTVPLAPPISDGEPDAATASAATTRIEYYFYGEFYAAIGYWRAARDSATCERWERWARRAYPNLLARRRDDGLWSSTVSVEAETAFALCALLVPREGAPFFLR